MDAKDFPSQHLDHAVAEFCCPRCGSEPGYRCQSSSGNYYDERHFVHVDRMITLYRTAYEGLARLEGGGAFSRGYDLGRSVGWKQGVEDARYTFGNTPVDEGAAALDSLAGVMADALGPCDAVDGPAPEPLRLVSAPTT